MTKRFIAIINLIVAFAVVVWNYLANTGRINGKTVGGLSDELDNLFTPAGYAFAIWGLIFLGLIVNGIYQLKVAFGDDEEKKNNVLTGPWLIIANIANAAWIWFWLHEETGTSVILMVIILLALIKVTLILRLENYHASKQIIAFGWWPNTIYLGWISVALIANTAAYLSKIGWADTVDEVMYTIIMIVTAMAVNLFMLYTRNMREFCLVGIWSLFAVAMANKDGEQSIYIVAVVCASILCIITIIHGIKNRKTNPFLN
ncbi:MAG: tryptophan-rich sensory protein [Crocinitomicaceae bacterium]